MVIVVVVVVVNWLVSNKVGFDLICHVSYSLFPSFPPSLLFLFLCIHDDDDDDDD